MQKESNMNDFIEKFANQVIEIYESLKLPNRYKLDEVEKILKEKYLALEEELNLADLEPDAKKHVKKYLVISNPDVLKSLFTSEEKLELYAMIKHSEPETVNFEFEIEKVWNDIQQGRRINIILESLDNKYLSGFTLQGMSKRLFNELMVYKGIDSFECFLGNEKFHEYLKRLIKAKIIKL